MRGESVSTYPRRPKAEAFRDAVDVVERLRDPTDPSTERTAKRRLGVYLGCPLPTYIKEGGREADPPRGAPSVGSATRTHKS